MNNTSSLPRFSLSKVDFTTILIPFVYFIAGASSLAGIATTFFFKDDLGLTIEQTQIIASLQILPWSIKPIYGFVSDRAPVFDLRRKPYLILAGILASAGYLSLGTWVGSFSQALFAVILSGFGFALADVIVDGIVAERSKTQAVAGKLQVMCRAGLMLGALSVAYLSGYLVEEVGPRNVFLITGSLPVLTIIFAFFIKEIDTQVEHFSFKDTWRSIKGALTPGLIWAAVFLFIWRATPSSGEAFTYYLIDELSFNAEFFGRLRVIAYLVSILTIVIFRKWLVQIPLKKLLVWVVWLSVILSLPTLGLVYGWYEYLGMSPKMFAMADTLISGGLVEMTMIPLTVLVARVCPKGIEATMFAILASIMNIGLALSDALGAVVVNLFGVRQATDVLAADYSNLHWVLWIAILSSLLPLPLIRFLPDISADEKEGVAPSGTSSVYSGEESAVA